MLAVSWDFCWGCQREHLHMASSCGCVFFLTEWRLDGEQRPERETRSGGYHFLKAWAWKLCCGGLFGSTRNWGGDLANT